MLIALQLSQLLSILENVHADPGLFAFLRDK